MPISLDGKIGPQARRVATFVETLRRLTDLPIVTVDERYTTAEAERLLRLAGRKPSRNKGGGRRRIRCGDPTGISRHIAAFRQALTTLRESDTVL